MVLSKDQVKSHIAGVESRISDPLELKHHGYEFAKLLYQVKEYDSAVIYLANFISVNGRDPRAHKLMGHLCNATAENGKAIAHYKRSLELKRGQRDVIEALVSVYLKLEKPPVGSLKECLQHIEAIGQTHPLIVPLCEKIQSLEGGFSMEKVINKALAVNMNDVNLHIRLVKLYCQSGKSQEAFHYCEDLYRAGQLTDSLQWQLFALATAEDYYENVRAKGVRDGVETLEILVTLLEFTTTLFNLLACPDGDLDDSAALLLKFDKVLCASGQMLSVLPPSALPLFQMALKQLCAQLYFMAGRYLYLLAWRQRQSLLSSVNVASIMGIMCMLSSMKAPPWDLEQYQTLDQRTHLRLRTWYNAACARTSIAGRHLMLIEAAKGKLFFEILPKIATEMGGKLHLIKTLFGGTTSRNLRAKFGSRDIKFSLQESFLSEDGTFLTLPVLPSARELEDYDRECIAQERQLCNLLWRCLAYKALNKQPFLFLWLGRMFNDLRLDTPTLDSTEPSTLCVLDFEAFLVHLLTEYSERLTSPQLFSVPPMTTVTLTTALASCLPFCLILKDPHRHYWTALLTFLLGNLSAQDAAGVKKVVREFLSFVRGSSPLQLSLEHLTSLARHFKKRAEMETDGGDDRDVIMMLLKRSCHYWAIVEDILSPSSNSSQSALLAEARMTIANEALYRQDMSKALRLYSRVKTAPSAWNQSEVYLHLADMSGQADTREKLDSRLDNLQKAAEALDLAIARLTPEHEIKNLRQKFLSQRDSIKDLLGETKKSPLAGALDYEEESPSVHRRFSSTPAHTKTPSLSHMTSPFTDQNRKQEQKLSEMASQLEKLQAEMDLIKSRTTRTYNQSQMSPQGHTGMQSHGETILSYGPRLLPPADPPFQGQLSPHGLSPQGLSQQWSAGQLHGQTSPRQTSPLNMFQLQPNRMAMFSQQRSPLQRYPTPPPAVAQPSNSFQGVATGIQTFTTQPRPFAPRSPINRPPHSVGLTLPQHLQSHSFIPAIGGPQLISPSAKPLSPGAASNTETMPTTNEQVVSTTPQNRLSLTPKFQLPPALAHFSPSIQPTAGLGNLSPSQQPLPVKNTSFPFTVSPTSPKNDDITTKSGMKRTASGFGVLQSPLFSFTTPVTFTFGQTTSSTPQFPAFGMTTTADGTSKPLTTSKELPSIVPKSYSFPVNIQPPPSSVPVRTSSGHTFTMPSFSMNPTTSPLLATSSQPFSILGNSSLFTFANTSPTQSPVVTSVQTETIATSKETFPILSSLLSKNWTGSQPSTAAIGVGLLPKEAPKVQGDYIFSTTGASIFSNKSNNAEQDQEDSSGAHDTSDNDPQFYSIVDLPELDNILSGEEDEETLFVERAKLYRFHNSEWKDKGLGEMKVLKHRSTGKFRLLMRRDQILKICCNHYVVPAMKFKYLQDSKRMLCWFTNAEFSDQEIKSEKLAIKFKTDEIATNFKQTVEFAVEELGKTDASNKSSNSTQKLESDIEQLTQTGSDIRGRLAPPKGSWSCDVCLLTNKESANECVACSTKNPNSNTTSTFPTSFGEGGTFSTTSTANSLSFGESGGFKLSTGLLSFGTTHAATTAATGGPLLSTTTATAPTGGFKMPLLSTAATAPTGGFKMPLLSTAATAPTGGFKMPLMSTATTTAATGIRGRLAPPKGSWSCDVCLVTNKESANECVACSTKNPNSNTTSTFPTSFGEGGTFSTTSTANLLSFGESGGFKLSTGLLSFGTTHAATTAATGGPLLSTTTATAPTGGFKMPLLSTAATAPTGGFKMPLMSTATTTAATGIRGRLAPPKGSWSCDVCLVTNKESANECVACSTKNPNSAAVNTTSNFPTSFGEGGTFSTMSTANLLSFGESGGFKLSTGLLSFGTTHAATTAATGGPLLSTTTATAPTGGFKMPLLSTAATAPTGGFKMPLLSTTTTTAPTGGFKLAFPTTALSGGFQSRSGLTFPSFSFGAATTQQEIDKYEDRESTEEDSGSVTPDHHVSRSDPVDELSDVENDSTDSVLFVSEEMPPPEKVELAKKYLLPITFFNYEKKPLCPGCRGCTEDPPVLEQPGDPEPHPNSEASGDNSSETVSREEGNKVVEDGAGVKQEDGLKETTINASFSFLPSEGKASSFSELASGGGFQWSSGKSQGFSGAGRPLFGSSSGGKDGEGDPETEVDITFKPLVTLPEVETKTGEEFDEAVFSHRAKLYRYDSNVNQWKERGVGDIKIMRNKTTNKTRIIMRRDLIKKLCCNHFINSVKYLTPNEGSDRSWVWYTPGDFSDGEARPEKLAVRFKYQETATEFKNVFDKCKQLEDPDLTTEKPEECEEGKSPVGAPTEVRSNVNEQDVISNTSSNEESHDSVSEHDETDGDSIADDNNQLLELLGEDLRLKLAPPPGAWTCVACLVSNKPTATHCVACNGTDREETTEVSTLPLKLAPPLGAWTCVACLVSNKPTATHCVSCNGTDREETTEVSTPLLKLAPPPGAWTCAACLVSNKPTATHCVACNGTDREETTEVSTPPLKLAPPPGAWTCAACLVSNKPTATHCVACNGTDREETTEVSTPPFAAVNIYSPDSSTNLNPLLRFPLVLSPVSTVPYVCPKPVPPLETTPLETENPLPITPATKKDRLETSPLETENLLPIAPATKKDRLETSPLETENPLPVTPDTRNETSPLETENPLPVTPDTRNETSPLETENPLPVTPDTRNETSPLETENPLPVTPDTRNETSPLETENPLPVTPDTRNETSPLETENPLPVTPDTRNETSPLETENPLPVTPASKKDGSHSQSEPTLLEEPETESQVDDNDQEDDIVFLCEDLPDLELVAKAKQLMLPPSFFLYEKKTPCSGCRGCRDESDVESDVEDISTHSESDASITQDPPEEITFAPAKQPPSPVGKPKGFFSQADQVSFSDLAPQQTTSGFATTTPGFQFQGAGKQLFAVRSADDGKANPEEEIDINFKPLVSLPKVAPTKSWDNEAGTLFSNRGKLFRFDDSVNQWKERGVGDIKILQHTGTGRCRILMRRDQILKICCNHNITADMTLLPGNTDKSWVWFTQSDFTDEEPKKEKLAVRFKHAETAREFKEVFEQCVKRDTEL